MYEIKPYTSTNQQYKFYDNTATNACINDSMWVTNEFYNTSGGNNSDYSKQWFIFEYSVDDGSNWSAAKFFTGNPAILRLFLLLHHPLQMMVGLRQLLLEHILN